jgi:alkanesulfonate monooxygenase SsuD/methylene tetrahydromethanopterin reductase-like flavin-dependent oxidoreductase (luciferase family)
VRIGVKPGQWGWSFEELESSWRAAEEAGFGIISCFDHVTASPGRQAAWDAPSLLAAMAGATRRVTLAVDVVNVALRHPFLLAAQLAVAQAASGGRVTVALGAGSWHLARFDHQALGLRFPPLAERYQRLAHCCQALPALWRGDEVTDPVLGLDRASLGPLGITVPPVLVGGTSDTTMTVAVTHADGWNASIADARQFAELSARVDELCRQVGRDRPLRKTAQVFTRDTGLTDARRLLGELEQAGADAVTFVLTSEHGPQAVRSLARAVL